MPTCSKDLQMAIEITDMFKEMYCPRQYFYLDQKFKESDFFTKYCASVPCRGDIDCNRAACWEMLANRGPYVQDDMITVSQTPNCPSDFFGRLSEYAHDCGAVPEKIFKQYRSDFGGSNFACNQCTGFLCRTTNPFVINDACWTHLLAELKTRQK